MNRATLERIIVVTLFLGITVAFLSMALTILIMGFI